jgi:serine/threonine protein phosphatase PrpC
VDLDGGRTHLTIPARGAADSPAPAHCREPGCTGTIEDGYCNLCGARGPTLRDHFSEQPATWVGAVSDRGHRHWRNEDAMATAADAVSGSFCALVVCDGVTPSTDSDQASARCAAAAREILVDAHRAGWPGRSGEFWTARLAAAAEAADAEAVAVAAALRASATAGATENPPASTFVAAVYDRDILVCGSVGDSRAYWLPDDGTPVQLTTDDSWASEQVRAGLLPQADAEADARAHAITRWLGADSPDATATMSLTPTEGVAGWLLACTDGLWNYCSSAKDLAALVARTATAAARPVELAGALVQWANDQGGQDNVTVVLARIPGTGGGGGRTE